MATSMATAGSTPMARKACGASHGMVSTPGMSMIASQNGRMISGVRDQQNRHAAMPSTSSAADRPSSIAAPGRLWRGLLSPSTLNISAWARRLSTTWPIASPAGATENNELALVLSKNSTGSSAAYCATGAAMTSAVMPMTASRAASCRIVGRSARMP